MRLQAYCPKALRRPLRSAYLYAKNIIVRNDAHFVQYVSIEISTACNRRCQYCPVSSLLNPTKQTLIKPEVFRLILSRLAEINWDGPLDFVRFNEPLLHPGIVGICKQAAQALPRAMLGLTTNGDRLTEELLLELTRAGVYQFNVTRHPPFSDEWDTRIGDLRKRYADLIHYLNSPGDEGWSNRGGLVTLPAKSVHESLGRCNNVQLIIDKDARVLFCCDDVLKQNPIGELRTQTIRDIWYDPKNVQERKLLRRGIASRSLCRRCMGIGATP